MGDVGGAVGEGSADGWTSEFVGVFAFFTLPCPVTAVLAGIVLAAGRW